MSQQLQREAQTETLSRFVACLLNEDLLRLSDVRTQSKGNSDLHLQTLPNIRQQCGPEVIVRTSRKFSRSHGDTINRVTVHPCELFPPVTVTLPSEDEHGSASVIHNASELFLILSPWIACDTNIRDAVASQLEQSTRNQSMFEFVFRWTYQINYEKSNGLIGILRENHWS